MKLYFDIGNTNIKMNFKYESKEYYVSFKTKMEYSPDSLFNLLPKEVKESKINKIFICSVVPKQQAIIEGMCKKYFQIKPTPIAFPLKTGIKIKAINPKRVGGDLICLSAFAASKSNNSIIINLGTSTTITHIENQTMMGTIIAPGIKTSFTSLIDNAAGLHEMKLELPDKKIGNNTEDCISIGVLKGHVHMLRGFIKEIDQDAQVYISGGHSKMIREYINAEYVKEATLEGMKVIESLNEN